uniref:Multifunctional methyltransferase subunit TRM112-like protein n=2 Tax=Emiliania huxleyi TaxID=2903 RepID=A0A7S3TCK8_EMIHU
MLMAPGTKNGFPLAIEVEKMETVESEFRSEFTARMVQKVEYGALLQTLAGLGMDGTLPPAVPDSYESNEEFLRALHHVLMEVEVIDGTLVCPETGKRFPIKDGIPSML